MIPPGFPSGDARMNLYQQGLGDGEIARRLGIKRNTVTVWRRGRKLPPSPVALPYQQLSAEDNARRMLLYQLGWSDHHIARELRRDKASIRVWRHSRNLPRNFTLGRNERFTPRPGVESVVNRIRKAVGQALAADVLEDIVSDMIVAVLDGNLPLAKIEAEARRYGNRVLDRFASKFGPRSLDQEIGDGDGFTLMDTLVDESSSSWLEEMGATIW